MLAKVWSFATKGIDGILVQVEVDLSNKLPKFTIVGLPDTAIREAEYRVKTAMVNSGLPFPYMRILINLAPADLKKQGGQYDLPISVGLLAASELVAKEKLQDVAMVGELALDGAIRPVRGIIAMLEAAYHAKIKKILVPKENADEAAVCNFVDIYPVSNLVEAVKVLNSEEPILPYQTLSERGNSGNREEKNNYADVLGQEYGKRAMLLAAAGGHHCIMIGPPGSGKTMLARRISSILPALSFNQSLETSRIYSVCGMISPKSGLVQYPPFRSPHHTISNIALVGGGSIPRPGELSLAHNGVLFLDELAEFSRDTLEVLRQPIETGFVTISRAKETMNFPAQFLLLAAMNPCPCGYFGDAQHQCRCSEYMVQRYHRRISGPLLDRFDLHLQIARIKYQDLATPASGLDSLSMKKIVEQAREIQKKRLGPYYLETNSQLGTSQIQQFCQLDHAGEKLLNQAVLQKYLSARAYHKILKISRTIADIEGSENILASHVAEAIQFRSWQF